MVFIWLYPAFLNVKLIVNEKKVYLEILEVYIEETFVNYSVKIYCTMIGWEGRRNKNLSRINILC